MARTFQDRFFPLIAASAVLFFASPAPAQLSPADQVSMTGYLEALSSSWDQPSVNAANTLFNKTEYTAENWRVFLEGYFGSRRMTEPLWNYLGYPAFWWFDEEVHTKLQTALDAVGRRQVRGVLDAHSGALGTYLSSSNANRDDLRFWLVALWNLGQHSVSSFDRAALFGWTRQLVDDFPSLLRSDHVIDPIGNPYVNWVRMQVHYVLCNSVPLTDSVKAQIGATIRIAGPERQALWNTHTVLLHDNLYFSTDDVTFFQEYFDALPQGLALPVGISVNDALGNSGATGLWVAARGGINVFQVHVRSCQSSRFEFPPDVPEFLTDCLAIVTAHEANHIVNALNIEAVPALNSRQQLLVQQAGSDPQNYLRSMIEAGFFVNAPQEFFASMANMYMTNTELTLKAGKVRLLAGRPSPLEQFLFFVDVYSGGSNVSRGFLTGTDAHVQWYGIPLVRNGQGRIRNFALRTKSFSVDYDPAGRIGALTEAPIPSSFYSVTPCRLFDTRNTNGPDRASPALAPGETRTFSIVGRCSLSAAERSLSVNQTVTGPTASGELVLDPGDLSSPPNTSSISFPAGRSRANNGILELASDGSGTFRVFNRSTGSVHFILDVNGTFQ